MPSHFEIIRMLQQADTPSIRLLALTRLKGLPDDHPQVVQEQAHAAAQEPVLSILQEQYIQGYWIWDRHYYSPKYRSSHWSMQLLTELGLSGDHPAMQKGALYMNRRIQDKLHEKNEKGERGLACFWGNFLRYELHCLPLENAVIQETITLLVREIERDGVCDWNYVLPCAWGVIRALWGLAAIPVEKRTPAMQHAIQHGLEFVLERYSLIDANYPYKEKIHKRWFSLNFPLFYNVDILFTLQVLHELDALDHPSARKALDWLGSKQMKNGKWHGTSPFRGRTWAFTAGNDTADTWATLHALTVLQ